MSTHCGLIKAMTTGFKFTARRRLPCLPQSTATAMRERRQREAGHRQRNELRLWAFTVSSA